MVNVQEYINHQYPVQEEREKVEELDISEKNLEGDLDLSEFINLKVLKCWKNKLISLNVSQCCQLEEIWCSNNQLSKLALPTNPTNLKTLYLNSNNFPEQDLSFLTPYTNLGYLKLVNNNFTGSLDFISKMGKLWELDISNTDLNEVNINKLPESLIIIVNQF